MKNQKPTKRKNRYWDNRKEKYGRIHKRLRVDAESREKLERVRKILTGIMIIKDFRTLEQNDLLRLLVNLKDQERITIEKDKEIHNKISKKYYDQAVKIIKLWSANPQVFVQKEKNLPILIMGDNGIGFVLAPVITEEMG